MAVASLIISIIAVSFTGWSVAYRFRDDARNRWWERLTWALDRYSNAEGNPADRQLAWELLTHHFSHAPAEKNEDDGVLLDAVEEWLYSVATDHTAH